MKKPVLLAVIMAGLLSGCVADSGWKAAYEQEKALRDQQEARIRNLETRQQQQQLQQTTPQQERALTRAESIEYCQSLDRVKDVPFACRIVTLSDGVQIMSFIFQDERTQEQWWISITVKLAAHYCATSNNMNIPAGLGQTLVNEDVLRIFSCRQQIWSKWVKADIAKNRNTPLQRY